MLSGFVPFAGVLARIADVSFVVSDLPLESSLNLVAVGVFVPLLFSDIPR